MIFFYQIKFFFFFFFFNEFLNFKKQKKNKIKGVIVEPFQDDIRLRTGFKYLIVASDGLWDVYLDKDVSINFYFFFFFFYIDLIIYLEKKKKKKKKEIGN